MRFYFLFFLQIFCFRLCPIPTHLRHLSKFFFSHARSLNLVRGFYFEFCVIWKAWLRWIFIWLKIDRKQCRIGRVTTENWRHATTSNWNFPKRSLDLVRGFHFEFVWIEKFGFHWYSSDRKLTIKKQTISDLPDNDRKMTSYSNFKLRFSERSLDVIRGFLFQFGVIWKVWLPGVII